VSPIHSPAALRIPPIRRLSIATVNDKDPTSTRRPEAPETLLRHWNLLKLLPTEPGGASISDLLVELEEAGFKTTPRTLQRDLKKLSVAFGFENDEGRPPRWYWPKAVSNSLRLPILNSHEALTFILVKEHLANLLPASVLEHLDPFFGQAEKAMLRLRQNRLKDWPKKVAAVPASQPLLPPAIKDDVQRAVSDALLRERMLRLMYQKKGAEQPEERIVHPLGLVTRGSMVYLIAAAEDHEAIANPQDKIRLRAMHRIDKAEIMDYDPVRVPDGFDLDRFIAQGQLGFGQGRTILLKAAFTQQAAQHLHDTPLTTNQTITSYGDGRVLVAAELPETQQLTWWLLGFGDKVEVLEPAHLREEMAAIAKHMHRRYLPAP